MNNVTIELNKDLTPMEFVKTNSELYGIAKRINVGGEDIHLFGNPSDVVYHEGYLNYLAKAWSNHYSIVLRPDDIWYMILSELTTEIAKTPKDYANLFTTKPKEKQLIVVLTDDVRTIDPALVIMALKDYVPSKIDDFLPSFSTSTEMSSLAMNVAFCDLVSPYYSYGTLLCGIPSIRIEGTQEDWKLVKDKLANICCLFTGKLNTYLFRCCSEVGNLIKAINNKDADYFNKMIKLEQCGSGHQFEMNGWILRFLNRKNPQYPLQLEGLPPHMAKMDYINLDTNRTFSLYCGMFYSQIQGGFMIPQYDAFRIETTPDMPKKDKPKDLKGVVEMALSMMDDDIPISYPNTKLDVKGVMNEGFVYAPYIPKNL